MSKVPRFASTKIAISATHISTLPATKYSVSFIALYSFVRLNFGNWLLLPHTPMSRYIGSTESS